MLTLGLPRMWPLLTLALCRYVRDPTTGKEGWVPSSSLSVQLGPSGSAQCLSSSGKAHVPRAHP